MDNKLRARIEGQIRERLAMRYAETEAQIAEVGGRHFPLSESPEDMARRTKEMLVAQMEAERNRMLPFALKIAERDGVTDRLSDDQCDEAGLSAAQLHAVRTLQQFETRLEYAPSMRPDLRQFAEAFLANGKVTRRDDGGDRR